MWATLSEFFYMHHPTDRIANITAFITPVVEDWLERDIAQWVHHEGSIRRPITPSRCFGEQMKKEEMFYLMTHSTHFIYVYIASDIW